MHVRAWTCRSHALRRRAFTLVELLVAMTIGSLLVVSVVSGVRALTGARHTVECRVTQATAAQRALDEIVGALRNVQRTARPDRPVVVGRRGTAAQGDHLDLLVTSARRARPDGPESDQQEVSFYLARLPGRELPTLVCRRDHGLDEHPQEGGIATVVADGIVGLTFEYQVRGAWRPEWSEFEPAAPDAVRVIVTAIEGAARGTRPQVLSTVVPLHSETVVRPVAPGPEQGRPTETPRGGPPE